MAYCMWPFSLTAPKQKHTKQTKNNKTHKVMVKTNNILCGVNFKIKVNAGIHNLADFHIQFPKDLLVTLDFLSNETAPHSCWEKVCNVMVLMWAAITNDDTNETACKSDAAVCSVLVWLNRMLAHIRITTSPFLYHAHPLRSPYPPKYWGHDLAIEVCPKFWA